MTPEEAIELLKGMQSPLEDYAELVVAPAFAYGHKYAYPDPQDYAIEEAIEALENIQQYREIGTVEECREAMEKQKHMNDGWIPVSERLPEEKINPVTQDFFEYQVTAKFGNVEDVRHYNFGNGHWWHGSGIVDEYVVAWRENPEPYKVN